MAVDALGVVAQQDAPFGIEGMHLVGALAFAHAAGDAALAVADDLIFGIQKIYRHIARLPSSLSVTITGSPPRGAKTRFRRGLHRADGAFSLPT